MSCILLRNKDIKRVQFTGKGNNILRLIFYAKTFGRETKSAKPLLNLLDILTVDNIYRLEVLKFSHLWHNSLLPEVFHDIFQYARKMHRYKTRYTAKQNFISIKLELIQENNQFLSWQLIFGKTFHLL